MERKLTDRQYHVQDNADAEHKYVRKYYLLRFDPKLGNGVCAIRRIPFACVACTSMLDKPWVSGIPSDEQERYKPVTKCTYWPVLG